MVTCERMIIFQGQMSSKENGGSAATIARHKSEREKKLGHRRVGTGGEVTYKKVSWLWIFYFVLIWYVV